MAKTRTFSGLAALGAALAALPAWAQEAAEGAASTTSDAGALVPYTYTTSINNGDVAWMTTSTVLVLLMIIPGLALFYGGLVRQKNMLSVLTQVFAITAVMCIVWVVYGYSMAFTDGGAWNSYVGGFSKAFLSGVDVTTMVATFTNGVYLPEFTFVAFQMTFACITPALIVGAFAERIKFSSLLVF